ncbi:putative Zinc finger, SWIM-type [Plasmopara halstedii]
MEATAGCRSWPAPFLDRRDFASWEDFCAYIEEYERHTHQSFYQQSHTSVKTRNQVLASFAAIGQPLPTHLLPERFQDYMRVLQCAHKIREGEARLHTHWNEEGPAECQAKISATLQLVENGNYRVRVTKMNLHHNHPITRTATSAPAAPPQSNAVVYEMPSAKRQRMDHSRSYLESDDSRHSTQSSLDKPHVPTMADMRTFLQHVKMRVDQRNSLQSVEERLFTYVNEFAAINGNAARIFIDDEVLSSITLQTEHMRKVFEAFPEVLRVDIMPQTTDNEANTNHSMFSLMAHDVLGRWQYVQHAIVESDRTEILQTVLDQFKENNALHVRVRALIVPSVTSPILNQLLLSFPNARVLYTQFHVLRELHKAIADHGQDLTSWHRDRLTSITQALVYAPTALVYDAEVATMADVLGSKHHPFYRYFLMVWDTCRDCWTTFARQDVTTFTISEIDGQFASTWKEIFAAVNDDMALDETVMAIRYFQSIVERTFMRDLKSEVSNSSRAAVRSGCGNEDYDAEMRLLAAAVSPSVSSLVYPQYRFAMSRGVYQFAEPTRGNFFVSAVSPNGVFSDEPTKEFLVVTKKGWQCSCAFMKNHHLPCRHVFYIRRIIRCSTLVPMEHIEPRWILAMAKTFFELPFDSKSRLALADRMAKSMKNDEDSRSVIPPPGAWRNFMAAQEVGKRISQRMMEMDPVEFDRALRFYKLVESTLNVRPFNLNAGVIARLKSQPGGIPSTPPVRPHYVEPETTRSLAPPGGLPDTSNESNSSTDSTVITVRNMRLAQSSNRPVPKSKPLDVIDLQDDSEDEKNDKKKSNGWRHQGYAVVTKMIRSQSTPETSRMSNTMATTQTRPNHVDSTKRGERSQIGLQAPGSGTSPSLDRQRYGS